LNDLDSQDGAFRRANHYPIGLLPASRLTPPRSGPERSDFVPWRNLRLRPKTAFRRIGLVRLTPLI